MKGTFIPNKVNEIKAQSEAMNIALTDRSKEVTAITFYRRGVANTLYNHYLPLLNAYTALNAEMAEVILELHRANKLLEIIDKTTEGTTADIISETIKYSKTNHIMSNDPLAQTILLAKYYAKKHQVNYNIILLNPDEKGESTEYSTYEFVTNSYFDKPRDNVKKLYTTDELIAAEEKERMNQQF